MAFSLCLRVDESGTGPSVLSLPAAVPEEAFGVGVGGSLPYRVSISSDVLCMISLSFVVQKPFSQPSVLLQVELLCK